MAKPYTLEDQLGKPKVKKKSTFGKHKPKKIKKSDILDNDYLNWLCTQPCVVTGRTAERGAGAECMHAHHIEGRNRSTNDYETVPLIGYVHTWGLTTAYHSIADSDYKKKYIPHYEGTVKDFFKEESRRLRREYGEQGGTIYELD